MSGTATFCFRRAQRLLNTADFSATLKARIVLRGRYFVIHARPNEMRIWRLGLLIPKRYATRSVERNLVKRLWRENFRKNVVLASVDLNGYDLVVRMMNPPRQSRSGSSVQEPVVQKNNRRKKGAPLLEVRDVVQAEIERLMPSLPRRLVPLGQSSETTS